MLLSNLTHSEEGSKALLMLDRPVLRGYHASKLIDYFIESSSNIYNNKENEHKKDEDSSAWIANVILNISQTREGRELLVSKDSSYLKPLLQLLWSPGSNIVRRRALVGTIR